MSEALRDLIRESLIQQKIAVESDTPALGGLALVQKIRFFHVSS